MKYNNPISINFFTYRLSVNPRSFEVGEQRINVFLCYGFRQALYELILVNQIEMIF